MGKDALLEIFKSKGLAVVLAVILTTGTITTAWALTGNRISNIETAFNRHLLDSDLQAKEILQLKDLVLELRLNIKYQTEVLNEFKADMKERKTNGNR